MALQFEGVLYAELVEVDSNDGPLLIPMFMLAAMVDGVCVDI